MWAIIAKLIVVLGSIGIFLGLLEPVISVSAYVIFRPLIQPFAWLQYKLLGLPIATPLATVIVGLYFIFPLIRKKWSLMGEKSVPFLIFILLGLFSISYTDYLQESLAAIIKLFTVWSLFIITYNAAISEAKTLYIIDAIIVSSVIPLLFGFYQAITGRYDIIHSADVKRISSVFGTGNDYGIFLTFVTAATVIRLVYAYKKRTRIFLATILIMIMISQILSLNRGTWIALTMGFIVSAIKYRNYLNFKWIVTGVLAISLLFSGKIIQRFEELEKPTSYHYFNKSSLEMRLEYWQKLYPIALERPVIGHGIGTVVALSRDKLGLDNKPHNDYLAIFVELGLVGLILYLIFHLMILFYFLFMKVKPDIWIWNFAALMLSNYFIIISAVQNVFHSILNFPIYMMIIAAILRMNRLHTHSSKIHPTHG